jgi:hypothetical protein
LGRDARKLKDKNVVFFMSTFHDDDVIISHALHPMLFDDGLHTENKNGMTGSSNRRVKIV